MWVGLFLICVGVLIILSNMNVLRGEVWDYAWPLLFIFLGASMILKRVKRRRQIGHSSGDDHDRRGAVDDVGGPQNLR